MPREFLDGTAEIRSLDLDRDLDYYLNVLGLQLTAREGRPPT